MSHDQSKLIVGAVMRLASLAEKVSAAGNVQLVIDLVRHRVQSIYPVEFPKFPRQRSLIPPGTPPDNPLGILKRIAPV
jgi:hypothetical protein